MFWIFLYLGIGMLMSLLVLYVIGSVHGTFIKFVESAKLTPEKAQVFYSYPKVTEFTFYLLVTVAYPYLIYKLIWSK